MMANEMKCPECGEPVAADAPMGVCPKCLIDIGLGRPSPLRTTDGSGAAVDPNLPTIEELQEKLPEFEFIELLGHGGMGAVFRARQRSLERDIAIKILPANLESDPTFTERFLREAKALAQLSHPNIVMVFDFGHRDNLYYFAMEYVDGVNLRQAIHGGELEPQQALGVVRQICDALQYAHEQGVVHRDIKPENVLLDRHGRAKIADFGLAKIVSTGKDVTLTRTQQVVGTVHYMAPEQVEKPETVDHRADIYSLGVVFYELLTGELPIGRFAPPSEKVRVSEGIDDVVLKTLEKEPTRRYQHAVDVKTAVEQSIVAPVTTGKPDSESPLPSPAARASKPVSYTVPITTAETAVIFRGYGLLRIEKNALVIEYQLVDSVFGYNTSTVHKKTIELHDLSEIRLHRGFINHTIELQSHSLSVFDNIPGNRQGKVTLKLASSDLAAGEALVNEARYLSAMPPQKAVVDYVQHPPAPANSYESGVGGGEMIPDDVERIRSRLKAYSWAMLLGAVLNFMPLGVFFIPAHDEFEHFMKFLVLVFPAIAIFQIFGFFLVRRVKHFGYCSIMMIVSAIPIHPGAIFGLAGALGLFISTRFSSIRRAFEWTHDTQHASANSQIATKESLGKPGEAAMPRHRRSAKGIWVSALVLAIIVCSGLGVAGHAVSEITRATPPSIRYQITAEDGSKNAGSLQNQRLQRHIAQRLKHSFGNWGTVERQEGDQIRLDINRRYYHSAPRIARRLSLQGHLKVGVLAHLENDTELIELATKDMTTSSVTSGDQQATWVPVGNPKMINVLKITDHVSLRLNNGVWETLFIDSGDQLTNKDLLEVDSSGSSLKLKFHSGRLAAFKSSVGHDRPKKEPLEVGPLAVLIDGQLWFLPEESTNREELRLKGDLSYNAVDDLEAILRHGPLSDGLVISRYRIRWTD